MYHIRKFIRRIVNIIFPFRVSKKQQQNSMKRFVDPETGQWRKNIIED